MVVSGNLCHHIKGFILVDDPCRLEHSTAKRTLVHISISVLDVCTIQLLTESLNQLGVTGNSGFLLKMIGNISISSVFILCVHQLILDHCGNVLNSNYLCIFSQQFVFNCLCNFLYLCFRNILCGTPASCLFSRLLNGNLNLCFIKIL